MYKETSHLHHTVVAINWSQMMTCPVSQPYFGNENLFQCIFRVNIANDLVPKEFMNSMEVYIAGLFNTINLE